MRAHAPSLILLASCIGLINALPAQLTGCDVSNVVIPLPQNQTALAAPTDAKLIHIGAGVGTQNYSCGTTGTYTSIGAVAELFDASCIYKEISSFSALSVSSAKSALGASSFVLGHHYFVPNPITGVGVSPKFDFTSDSEQGNLEAYVVAAKTGDIKSPRNPTNNIDWVKLTAMPGQGALAKYVFRIDTIGGQPPTSCTPGSAAITVPYAALYWFYD